MVWTMQWCGLGATGDFSGLIAAEIVWASPEKEANPHDLMQSRFDFTLTG